MTKDIANRQIRRDVDRARAKENKSNSNIKKARAWIKTLSLYQANLIKDLVDFESKKYAEKISEILDRAYTAALIMQNNSTMHEVNEILSYTYKMIEDDAEKLKILNKIGDGDWKKAAGKYQDLIMDRATELIKSGNTKVEIIENLQKDEEFNVLSKAMIINAVQRTIELNQTEETVLQLNQILKGEYESMSKIDRDAVICKYEEIKNSGRCKSDKGIMDELSLAFPKQTKNSIKAIITAYRKEIKGKKVQESEKKEELKKCDPEVSDAVDYIFSNENQEEIKAKNIVKEVSETMKKSIKETNVETVKEVAKDNKPAKGSKFTVVKKEIVLKGQYGEYTVTDKGVSNRDLTFANEKEVDRYINDSIEKFMNEMNEFKAAFDA